MYNQDKIDRVETFEGYLRQGSAFRYFLYSVKYTDGWPLICSANGTERYAPKNWVLL